MTPSPLDGAPISGPISESSEEGIAILTNLCLVQKLDDKTLRRLETAVSKSEYSQGKKLKTVTRVDPDMLGGLVVEIGERTIDLSVSSKIARLNKMLTDTV